MIEISSHDWGNLESPWIGADISVWDTLTKGRSPVRFAAKQNIFLQGDPFSDIYIVASGRVCISMCNETGQEKHLYIACPGAMIGEISCILSKPHNTSAAAIVASDVFAIPSKEAQELFHSDKLLADMMLQYEARKAQTFIYQTGMLSFDSAEKRIARILLYLCDSFGKDTGKPGEILIDVRFTYDDLASIANTSRVTVNNICLGLAKQGILFKEHGRYVVKDCQALQSLAAPPEI